MMAGHDINEWVEPEMDVGVSDPSSKVKRLKQGFKKPSAKKSTPRCIFNLYFALEWWKMGGGGTNKE